MEVKATSSFIESLKNLNSWKNKYYELRAWFRYHLTKDFWKIIITAFKGYPWQESFLYDLERVKMKEMADYLEKSNRFVGVECVVRDIRLAIAMIDIFEDETRFFHYDGDIVFELNEDDKDTYTLSQTPDFKYNCDVYVNTRNVDRFCRNENEKRMMLEHPHELYVKKAKHLYHKIRYEKDNEWWD